jgi:hypothetical protein
MFQHQHSTLSPSHNPTGAPVGTEVGAASGVARTPTERTTSRPGAAGAAAVLGAGAAAGVGAGAAGSGDVCKSLGSGRPAVKRKASEEVVEVFEEDEEAPPSATGAALPPAPPPPARTPSCVSTQLPGVPLDVQFCPRADATDLFMVSCISGNLMFYVAQRLEAGGGHGPGPRDAGPVGTAGDLGPSARFVRVGAVSLSAAEDFRLVGAAPPPTHPPAPEACGPRLCMR